MRVLIIIATTLALTACATAPPTHPKPVPSDRQYAQPPSGSATLSVTRDSGLFGSACGVTLFVDGAKMAKLSGGERVQYRIASGQHIVGASASAGICNTGLRETQIDAKSDQTIWLRVSMGGSGDLNLAPTAAH